jgi:hypothetical protein
MKLSTGILAFLQGLKPSIILGCLRHATQGVPRSCPFKVAFTRKIHKEKIHGKLNA